MSIIYMHTNTITGRSYIGKTVKSMKDRWSIHISHSLSGYSNSAFHRAIRKYGIDCWDSRILIENSSDPNQDEIDMIKLHQSHVTQNGYNILKGGDGPGYGEDNHFYGKSHSLDTKLKISNSKTGISVNKGKCNPSFIGYYITPWGKFDSIRDCVIKSPFKLSSRTIHSLCRNLQKPISKKQIVKSSFLSENDLGKTPLELGFNFHAKID